jgi:vancomycin resistance protein VanJ
VKRVVIRVGAAYAAVVAVLLAFGVVSTIEDGPVAIIQILTPHLALACLPLVVITELARSRALAVTVAVVAVLFVVRFGSEWWSFSGGGAGHLRVATFNINQGPGAVEETIRLLLDTQADLVALEDLDPELAAAIVADPGVAARFPYLERGPNPGLSSVGLLSRFPLENATYSDAPISLEATLILPDRRLTVFAVHASPVVFEYTAGLPSALDPAIRNAQLVRLRERVGELQAAAEPVLVLGDFNTAPTEPMFWRFTGGMHDAHAEVGVGPGWTWRPERFAFLGIGLLRIDLVLTTSGISPTAISTVCPPSGDHCLVQADLRLDLP